MKKLIVISADAMVDADLPLLFEQPVFKDILPRLSLMEKVRTIYPTVTYPAHTSMASGAYPDKHGVTSNEDREPGMIGELPWCWFHRAVKVKDIFDAAKAAGYTTASVYWPVTGNHPSIDYLIDEYWPQDENDSLIEAFRRAGSSEEVIKKVIEGNIQGARMRYHPESDAMGARFVTSMIREFRPDVLFFHPANIDHFRHATGLFSEDVSQAVRDTAKYLADIIQATKDAGVFDETNFVLMSDHGQMNVNRVIHPNVILADNGLIRLDENGNPVSWDAFAHSVGMASYVYLKPGADDALRTKVHELLKHLADEGIYGISEVFTRDEIDQKEKLSGDFEFVLETDGYISFGQRLTRPLVTVYGDKKNHDYRLGHATHGYLPDKGPQPVFMAWGPDFKEGLRLERRPIVDIPCTLAKLLGTVLPDADGRPIDELIK